MPDRYNEKTRRAKKNVKKGEDCKIGRQWGGQPLPGLKEDRGVEQASEKERERDAHLQYLR